jgi:hypothetical protein
VVTEDVFFAWLDGELDGEEAKRIAAEVEVNPALSGKAEQHRALRRRLANAFGTVATAPLPESLSQAERPEPEVIDFAAIKRSIQSRGWAGLPQWAAIAATLALGIFVGTMVPHRSDDPVTVEGGKVYAAAALDQALTAQLASAPSGGTRIGLTFRDQAGSICRTFAQGPASGLACRDGGRWQVRGLFGSPEGQSGSYRMAAGMDPNLAGLINSTMTGDPFDASQEKAARNKGWR